MQNFLSCSGIADVSVLTPSGGSLPIFTVGAEHWVAGVPGTEFGLRVANRSSGRIEVLVSVDGQDVLKPQLADKYANSGFVIASGFYDFKGFRLDDDRVAAFKFGIAGSGRSMASKLSGSDANSGVFGFAVYPERQQYRPEVYLASPGGVVPAGTAWQDAPARSMTRSVGVTAQAAPAASNLATEAGEIREDKVGRTSFERARQEPYLLVIRYDTEAALRSRGIIKPDPFPGRGTGYESLVTGE